jgi:uncharacterized membrane protein
VFTFESSALAFVVLIGATVLLMAIAGPVLAYLIWANDHGIQTRRRWAVWLVSMIGLLGWAHAIGAAMRTPGIEDAYAFVALGLGIPVGIIGYVLKSRSLARREP